MSLEVHQADFSQLTFAASESFIQRRINYLMENMEPSSRNTTTEKPACVPEEESLVARCSKASENLSED